MTRSAALDTADIVVVGGGLAGLTSAFELRRLGFDVVVVEQRFLAFGASGRNPGALWIQTRREGAELELARRSANRYEEYLDEFGRVFDFRRDGGLVFFETEEQAEVLRGYVTARAAAGVEVELLTRADALTHSPLVPAAALGAVYCAEDSHLDSAGFVKALGEQCVRLGVRRFENTAVLSTLRIGDDVIGVRTVRGDIHASGVVWATGAWATNLEAEGIAVPMTTARMGQIRLQSIGHRGGTILHGPRGVGRCGAIKDLPGYSAAAFAPPGRGGVEYDDCLAHATDGGIWVGSSIDGYGSLNPHISVEATAAMLDTVLDRLPEHAERGVTGLWAGLVPSTADHLPIVDRVDGAYLNCGHSWGVGSTPMAAEVLAQLITGEADKHGIDLGVARLTVFAEQG